MTLSDEMIEEAARAIFDADNGIDGDTIGTMIHEDFRINDDDGNKGITNTLEVCKLAAHAALEAVLPSLRKQVLESAERICWAYADEQDKMVRASAVARAIRSLMDKE